MAGKPPPQEQLSEVGLHELTNPNIWTFLGGLAAKQLTSFGQVTFLISDTNHVAMANPVHVYLGADAIVNGEEVSEVPPYRWVRPIIGSGKPQHVAMRDGQLWEIEFINEEPQKADS